MALLTFFYFPHLALKDANHTDRGTSEKVVFANIIIQDLGTNTSSYFTQPILLYLNHQLLPGVPVEIEVCSEVPVWILAVANLSWT